MRSVWKFRPRLAFGSTLRPSSYLPAGQQKLLCYNGNRLVPVQLKAGPAGRKLSSFIVTKKIGRIHPKREKKVKKKR